MPSPQPTLTLPPSPLKSLWPLLLFGYLIPLLLLLAGIFLNLSGADLHLAESISQLEGGKFAWQNSYGLAGIIHQDGRRLVVLLYVILLLVTLISLKSATLRPYRSAFVYLLASVTTSLLLISGLKTITTLPCPWSLQEFGGDLLWTNLSQVFDMSLPLQHCFPSGHASSGYSWIALGFLAPLGSRAFWLGLIPGVLLGLLFGIGQQLRGAHFLSHDFFTLAICWFSAFVFSQWLNVE